MVHVVSIIPIVKLNLEVQADDAEKRLDERNKGVMFKNCAPFPDCLSEINNTQIDHAKYIDFVMPMYNLIEYSNNYSEMSVAILQR